MLVVLAYFKFRDETGRLFAQLRTEFHYQQFSDWQSRFQALMGELLVATDPEIGQPKKDIIVPLVLKAQLMLNLHIPEHAVVNSLINQIALEVCGWNGVQPMPKVVWRLHSALLEATRASLYLPSAPRVT